MSAILPVLPFLTTDDPRVTLSTVWECCSWPSPCFGGCDGGRTTVANVCGVCGQWTKDRPETLRHHRMCPVINWKMAEYGARDVDGDGCAAERWPGDARHG